MVREVLREFFQIQGQLPFDFFGLGQNVLGQHGEQEQQQNQENPPNEPLVPQNGNDWLAWPEVLPAAQQALAAIEINLNAPLQLWLKTSMICR